MNKLSRRQFLTTSLTLGAGLLLKNKTAQAATYRRIYCPILMYHYISYPPPDADNVLIDLTVAPELFNEHLNYLQTNGYSTVSMSELWSALNEGMELPPKPVVLTFDDGYDNAYGAATPLLVQHGMKGTFYIVSSFMDQPGYLSWGMAGEMKNAGMEIGNHSATHPNLSGRNREFLMGEIETCSAAIATALGERPTAFCYPLGRYDNNTVAVVRETGHTTATTTADGTLHYTANPLRLRRIRIRNTTSTSSLEWLLNRRL